MGGIRYGPVSAYTVQAKPMAATALDGNPAMRGHGFMPRPKVRLNFPNAVRGPACFSLVCLATTA